MTRVEYQSAISRLRQAATVYYESDGVTLLMSDAEYDVLARSVEVYEEAHGLEDVSAKVASGAALTGGVEHRVPMLSLDNVFSRDEFTAWAKRVAGDGLSNRFCIDPKMDGLAVAIRYEDGVPVQMATRGDGHSGEDVTYALPQMSNLPRQVEGRFRGLSNPFTGEVRGEAIFTRQQFGVANQVRVEHGDKPFVNPRNGVAGALRGAKDRGYSLPFAFIAYDVADPDEVAILADGYGEPGFTGVGSYTQVMSALERGGFSTARSVLYAAGMFASSWDNSWSETADLIDSIGEMRDRLVFEIDGAVIKVDSYEARARIGSGTKAPRWAIAYKYPAQEVTSVLRAITWQVGRTGVITPRAEIDPVEVGGTTVTYSTLHNVADIARKGFMMGDHVLVKRAGEVVPRLEAPLPALRDGTQTEIVPPVACPQCGGQIDKSQERWRCAAGRACGLVPSLAYAVSRDALDIEGLATAQISALVASGAVSSLADLFTVTEAQLLAAGVPRTANGMPIVDRIAHAKKVRFSRVLTALSIQGTGRSASRSLAAKYRTMEGLRAATVDQLADTVVSVNRLGKAKAELIVDELYSLADVIDAMAAAGVNMGPDDEGMVTPGGSPAGTYSLTSVVSTPLAGKVVVVTGTMVSRSRNEMNELVESLGGRAGSSVSKSTDILVAGPGAGSKLAKATSLGVTVMTEDEFLAAYSDTPGLGAG